MFPGFVWQIENLFAFLQLGKIGRSASFPQMAGGNSTFSRELTTKSSRRVHVHVCHRYAEYLRYRWRGKLNFPRTNSIFAHGQIQFPSEQIEYPPTNCGPHADLPSRKFNVWRSFFVDTQRERPSGYDLKLLQYPCERPIVTDGVRWRPSVCIGVNTITGPKIMGVCELTLPKPPYE